ncbi:hypothetical protein DDB_G0284203 [Dictyostelium discoideum AX4]|uniref:Kynureninase n=1 Tax=Dictyostelium discoideum TaxID=44689 RepID=KYNU_DICDI|nr:hypothetical protein DDB_G0284203 [Dictyostelium discoideum AX4]Q54Q04.1 RecName: Full=Kynureninase; AltName: Full=L-kynurenine hydrolase [Dictyostelium discoideum]EAL65290.1 hypothetical protein DDB_G0284203 [Dictyostelium discoideum AX4]|eukprot:XP_638641.1 hypothetical protein DDB_G0284203 [Dictyostelium discoideum AX4]
MDKFFEYIKNQNLSLEDEKLADKLDQLDQLSSIKEEFYFPITKDIATDLSRVKDEDLDKPVIYLTGNSLGLQPKEIEKQLVCNYLNDWRKYGVEGHHKGDHPFIHIDEEIQASLSKIVGALPSEVCPMNSLSTNIHVLLSNFYKPTQTRHKIIIEYGAFPSDLYVTESQIRHNSFNPETSLIKIKPRDGEYTLRTDDIINVLKEHGDSVAVVMLSGIQYFTGQFFDMKKITEVGHEIGAIVGWDLAHAAGNVELSLHDWNVDFACWCTYKYLNSGPGCIAGIFVHSKHTESFNLSTDSRLLGWFGNKLSNRFQKEKEFVAEDGALGFRMSNPSVADCTALRASLSVFEKAGGIKKLAEKSTIITGYLEYLLTHKLKTTDVQIITPSEANQRGSQLSLLIKGIKASQLKVNLSNSGIVCDVRDPDVIRVAPAPLYTSFNDVKYFIQKLNENM